MGVRDLQIKNNKAQHCATFTMNVIALCLVVLITGDREQNKTDTGTQTIDS
jgi:hypothetical protein